MDLPAVASELERRLGELPLRPNYHPKPDPRWARERWHLSSVRELKIVSEWIRADVIAFYKNGWNSPCFSALIHKPKRAKPKTVASRLLKELMRHPDIKPHAVD